MRFIGPWRDRGIAEQPIEFEFRNAVAFAGPLLQRLMIKDPDVAAPIVDQRVAYQLQFVLAGGRSHYLDFKGRCAIADHLVVAVEQLALLRRPRHWFSGRCSHI